jgi:hypothetical protein
VKNINWGLVIGGLAVLATIYYGRKALEKVGEGLQAVNPTNPDNVFNNAATGAAQSVGLVDEGATIGGTLYEGLQGISSWFTGKPTDAEILAQQPDPARLEQLELERRRRIDGGP